MVTGIVAIKGALKIRNTTGQERLQWVIISLITTVLTCTVVVSSDLNDFLVNLSFVLFLFAFVPFIYAILHGARPSRSSWLIWATLDIITFFGMVATNAINSQIVGTMIGIVIVAPFVLKFGKPGWSRLDITCMSGAALGIIVWKMTANPIWAMVICQSIGFFGSWPGFHNVWVTPGNDSKWGWLMCFISTILMFVTMKSWTPEHWIQPAGFLSVQSTFMFLLWIRPWWKNKYEKG